MKRRTTGTRHLASICALIFVLGACSSGPKAALEVTGSIDGRPLAKATSGNPLALRPKKESVLALEMRNTTSKPIEVKRVRIEGDVLSITFLTYDVRVRTVIAPGETRALDVPLDFFDLDKQATGYVRAHLRLYDVQRRRISNDDFAIDIRGSIFSTMVFFALALLVLTLISTVRNVRDMKRRTLPANRFQRGLRFLIPGIGVGLLLSVGFSILRIFPLPAVGWIPLTLVPGAIAFAVGYFLTKAPNNELPEDDEADWEDDEIVDRSPFRSLTTHL
jgi:hypothetical protein